MKDVKYLLHDPLLERIRQYKVYKRKVKKVKAKKMYSNLENLQYFLKPEWNIDHIIKERFPSFDSAIKELDEALSMTNLFASLPSNNKVLSHVIEEWQAQNPPHKIFFPPLSHKKNLLVLSSSPIFFIFDLWIIFPTHNFFIFFGNENSKKISLEFQLYVIKKHALRKVFVSIKGIYYQAVIEGRDIIWLEPWPYTQNAERDDVDYRVMYSFLQLYLTLLGFINFRLYKQIGLHYPPVWDEEKRKQGDGVSALVVKNSGEKEASTVPLSKVKKFSKPTSVQVQSEKRLQSLEEKLKGVAGEKEQVGEENREEVEGDLSEEVIEEDAEKFSKMEEELASKQEKPSEEKRKKDVSSDPSLPLAVRVQKKLQEFKKKPLFEGLKFFLGRETLKECLIFVISSCGGQVGWDDASSPFAESDPSINYFVMDRPTQTRQFFGREYVQPQWVFDSVNERVLLPVHQYAPGVRLPDHLSPFVNDEQEGYTPKRREELLRIKASKLGLEIPEEEKKGEVDVDVDNSEELEEKYFEEMEAELAGKSFGEALEKPEKKRKKKGESKTNKEGDIEHPADHDLSGLLPKKRRRLYQRIQKGKERKLEAIDKLRQKRIAAEKSHGENEEAEDVEEEEEEVDGVDEDSEGEEMGDANDEEGPEDEEGADDESASN